MRHFLLVSALFLAVTASAHADTTFGLVNNTFASGATANGTIRIDTTIGIVNFVNITVASAGTNYSFTGAPSAQGVFDNNTQYFEYSFDGPGDLLLLDIPGASLIGYQGSSLCSLSNLCGDGYAGYFAVSTGPTSGVADPLLTGSLAATPEPSSIILLGTGLIGAIGAARRRFARITA